MLEREYEVFETNREKWLKKHAREFVVIHEDDVVGFFETQDEALQEAVSRFEPGEFLLQQILPKEDDTLYYHTRLIFS